MRLGSAHPPALSEGRQANPYDDVSWELPAHYKVKAIPTARRGGALGCTDLALLSNRNPAGRDGGELVPPF